LSSPLKFLFYWKKRGIDSEKQDSATSMVLWAKQVLQSQGTLPAEEPGKDSEGEAEEVEEGPWQEEISAPWRR
jgi:hypothetical protein